MRPDMIEELKGLQKEIVRLRKVITRQDRNTPIHKEGSQWASFFAIYILFRLRRMNLLLYQSY